MDFLHCFSPHSQIIRTDDSFSIRKNNNSCSFYFVPRKDIFDTELVFHIILCIYLLITNTFFLHKIIKDHACLSPSFKMSSQNYDFKEIFQLAEQGNRDALLVRNECIEIWGAAVINFIHAYDPEVVILGGGIMNSHKVIVPYIEERVSKFAWTPSAKVSVVVSSLGDYAALYGLEYCLRKKIKDEVFC